MTTTDTTTDGPQTEPLIGIKGLGHVVLYVADLQRSVAFYRDALGWPMPNIDTKGKPFAFFSTGRTHHELLLIEVGADAAPIPKGKHLGLYHFAVKVGDTDDELRGMLARITAAGVTIVGMSDHGVTHSIYILDPDGNEVELYIDVAGIDWKNHPESVSGRPEPLVL